MNAAADMPPPLPPPVLPEPAPSQAKTLRLLFLTLFLRGRGARGLNKQGAPKSVGQKLALTLVFYLAFGGMAGMFFNQPVFALATYLHAMTFVFLGMFVSSSAGEILFNKEEGDILLHRPITSRAMLWAKIRVLIEVSLWLAGAFNFIGLFVGFSHDYNWRFPLIHIVSTAMEALFCTSCVVLCYQLCLRWFGRERLEGLMTTSQVLVTVAAVMAGQILPRVMFRVGHVLTVGETSWWIGLLPPAWFAGLDEAIAGTGALNSWLLAGLAVTVTSLVVWLAFGKLAANYETGLQALNETISTPRRGKSRWIDRLVEIPPLSWWLRNPVARASFLLTFAYMTRDRDVKLRLYPGIAPILIIPFVFLLQNRRHDAAGFSSFGIAVSGIYLGLLPAMALQILQYSQQWLATDIFRIAPMTGPAQICHGARRAVLCLLTLPMFLLVTLIIWLMVHDLKTLLLLLPGIISLPIYALVPHLGGNHVPFTMPTDAAKSAGRSAAIMVSMFVSFGLAGLATWAWTGNWFWWLILGESISAVILYAALHRSIDRSRWPSDENGIAGTPPGLDNFVATQP